MTDTPARSDAGDACAAARLCAELLALGQGFSRWSLVLAVLAIAALIWGIPGPVSLGALLASLAGGAMAAYHALRVRLDAALFDDWARRWMRPDACPAEDLAAFDRALAGLQASGCEPRAGRTLTQRCAGARGLLLRQVLFTVFQTLSLLTAALVSA